MPGESEGKLSIFGISCKSSDPRFPDHKSFGSDSLIEGSTSHTLECPWKDFRDVHSPLALEFRSYTMHNPWGLHSFSIQLILSVSPIHHQLSPVLRSSQSINLPHNSSLLGYSIHTSPNIYIWLLLWGCSSISSMNGEKSPMMFCVRYIWHNATSLKPPHTLPSCWGEHSFSTVQLC